MNPTAKKVWLKALRSGKYKQGTGALCDDKNNFCCLGVLYDVAVDGYWRLVQKRHELAVWGICIHPEKEPTGRETNVNTGVLPKKVAESLGLSHHIQEHLADMNDDAEMNFDEIANWIEHNL